MILWLGDSGMATGGFKRQLGVGRAAINNLDWGHRRHQALTIIYINNHQYTDSIQAVNQVRLLSRIKQNGWHVSGWAWQMNIGNNNLWRSSATHTDCEISNLNISQIKFEITMDHPFIGEINYHHSKTAGSRWDICRKPVDVDHPTGTHCRNSQVASHGEKCWKSSPLSNNRVPKKVRRYIPLTSLRM